MPRLPRLRGQPVAVGLVVAVPAAQGGVAGVGKQKGQRRRFNGAGASCRDDGVEENLRVVHVFRG